VTGLCDRPAMHFGIVTILLVALVSCGGSKGAEEPAPATEQPAAEQPAEKQATPPVSAEKIADTCEWYAESKIDNDGEGDQAELTQKCVEMIREMSAEDFAKADECAGACGDSGGVVDCFEGDFSACEAVTDDVES